MAIMCLSWKKNKKSMTLFQRNCWPHFDIINTVFLWRILTSLWWHKWVQQEWALLSLAVVQQGFLFLQPLTGAKQHLQVFDHDQNFLFLHLGCPIPNFFLKIEFHSSSSCETSANFCHFGETSQFTGPSFQALSAKVGFLNVWTYPEASKSESFSKSLNTTLLVF